MDLLHKFLLGGEIFVSTAAALVAISVAMGAIRRKLDGPDPAWTVADVAIAEAKSANESWLHQQLVAFDIFLNALVLRGYQGETISSHSFRASVEGKLWGKLMTKWLNGFQSSHGQKAASGDLQRSRSEVNRLTKLLGL